MQADAQFKLKMMNQVKENLDKLNEYNKQKNQPKVKKSFLDVFKKIFI